MNTRKLKLYIGVICMTLLLPVISEAYGTTEQSAVRINDNTILYTVTYKFGFLNRELNMPIVARRVNDESKSSKRLEYNILNNDTMSSIGVASGMVLTDDEDVEIRDGHYYLPAGRNAEFTLMSILSVSPSDKLISGDLSLKLSNLPFTMINDKEKSEVYLETSELIDYKTPAVNLNH